MYTRAHSRYGSEVNGRFHYNGITAFENNEPYRYFREVPIVADPSVIGNIVNAGIYAQLQTRLAAGLNLTAGLRFDYAHYPSSPLNQLVLDELGVRTDHKLKSAVVQPRFQFTWDVNERRTDYIRFGAGVFASDINNYMTINNLVFDGKHSATVDVRAPNIPVADFLKYRADPSSVPTLEAFQLPTINTNAADAQVPVVYKANLSYSHYFTPRLRAGITGFVTLGRNNYMYVDRNMAAQPFFTLANEDNRGVYVPLNTMPANGVGDWLQGRISNKLGRVLELNSQGKVNQFALVVDGTYQYFRDGEVSFSYTWNDTRDNTSYNGNVANTATLVLPVKDDPRNLSNMTYSDNQFRHKVVVYGSLPTFFGVSVGIRYSGIGGTRYSLLSGVNSNADFVTGSNDLAFIFDTKNTDVPQNVRDGLTAIFNNPNASQSIKDYISRYSGRIAERNGGINDFFGIFDLRIGKKFKINKAHNIELSADIFNVANMVKKSWGVNKSLGTQALYGAGIPATANTPAVPAFDAEARRFVYRVNTAGIVNPSGDPFQVQIGLRYNF
jgi:hypothetical protein